jgi:YVTN family beta-propeller protein
LLESVTADSRVIEELHVIPPNLDRFCGYLGDNMTSTYSGVMRARLCLLLVAASALIAAPARGQTVTATAPDTNLPHGIAINPVTNKIYLADYDGTLTVIDGATNAASSISYSGASSNWEVVVNPVTNFVYVANRGTSAVDVFTGATATSPAQYVKSIATGNNNLFAIAINPVTNMIYAGNNGSGNVTVIDGSTNTKVTDISLGGSPILNLPASLAVNPATNMIYVVDNDTNQVSVINGSNSTLVATIAVGSSPASIAVNPATNKIYVANTGSNNVSVIDGSTDTVTATPSDPNASSPVAIAVNPTTNQIYVANEGSSNTTVIDGATNAVSDVGTNAGISSAGTSIVVDTSSNMVYVANSGNGSVSVINGSTLGSTVLEAQPNTREIAVNPVTHKVYAADFSFSGSVGVTVIDGATNAVQPITPPNQEPAVVAVNPVTNLIYVANSVSNNVSVIDGSTNTLLTTVATDAQPAAIVVDPVNNLVYVANRNGGDVTVIDSAYNTSTITFASPISPDELAFNPVLNMVFGASRGSGLGFQFSSTDGNQLIFPSGLFAGTSPAAVATNPAQGFNVYVVATTPGIQVSDSHGGFGTSICGGTAAPTAMDVNATTNAIYVTCADGTVDIVQGSDSFESGTTATLTPPGMVSGAAVAVNAVTNMAYVADSGSSSVYVINGATASVTATIPITSATSNAANPVAIAVNVATNKIYLVSQDNQNNAPDVTMIDGATNTILGIVPLVAPGAFTGEIAVNPVTGNIYALDWMASTIQAITENTLPPVCVPSTPQCILTTINPLPANSTSTSSAAFTFSASKGGACAPVNALYFQVDTQQGLWTPAILTGCGNFSGTASNLTPGFHILYAYATDGEDGTSGNSGPFSGQDSPFVGAIASYGFLVAPPIATINFYPLDYGNVPIGGVGPNPNPIIINEGAAPLSFSYTITGPNAADFVMDPNQSCPNPGIQPSNSYCGIYVTFHPSIIGPESATLTFTDNSLGVSNSMQSVGLQGTGISATGTVFSGLTPSQSISVGTSSINLSGTVSAGGIFPASGEMITITINSISQPATIGTNGAFSTAFSTSTIPASVTPYIITYSYAGDGNLSSASNSSTTLTVNAPVSFFAGTVTLLGSGTGAVTDNQSQVNCSEAGGVTSGTCSGSYASGSMVTFTANPSASTTFVGWGGACANFASSLNCTVNVISAFGVTATFNPTPSYAATLTELGTGTGAVTDSQSQINCSESGGVGSGTCSASYLSGTMVTFTANPSAPTTFGGWGGACSTFGTSLTCNVTVSSAFAITANFVAPPVTVTVTFPVGTNSTQVARFACPSGLTPCTDPNAHELQLTIPNVNTSIPVTVLATEVPPTMEDGLCESGNTVLNDFDCRFVTFFNGGASGNDIIVPLCYPYANGNCVHYTVYSTPGGPGVEPNPSSYSGGVYWEITWNNDTFTPPATHWLNSVPQFYDDPDATPAPGAAIGTNCNSFMTIGGMNQTYSCQFEFNITSFYDPTQKVDAGIGGSTKQFNDVVVAFPPASELPANAAPVFTSASSTTFTVGTQGVFVVTATGFPTPKISAASLPPGMILNTVTGILSGTPATTGIYHFTLTATNIVSSAPQAFTLTVQSGTPVFLALPSSQTIPFGTSSINLSGIIKDGSVYPPSGEMVTITINGVPKTTTIGTNGVFATTFSTATIPASATPYAIAYSYAGDSNFTTASNSSTTLTVTPLATLEPATVTLLGTGTGAVADNQGPRVNCSEAGGITAGTCSGSYAEGTLVTFTANPTAPTTFGGWGGACASSGTSLTCSVLATAAFAVTANFVAPPVTVNVTFPVGTNSTQMARFACPSGLTPCTDPNAHELQLTIPNVNTSIPVTVLATEVPPTMEDGLCESGNTVLNDFDCRFVTFFSDGTDAHGNTIVPLCYPYANGNCVHYTVYSTPGGPGVEPNPSSYSGGVYWEITWNNDAFTPPAPNYTGSTPQLYDDPDATPIPGAAVGTNCNSFMTIGGMNQTYSCQFEFNITSFYDPTQKVDAGIGGSTKQFNDVVVAFPPTVSGSNPVVLPPVTSAPAILTACVAGCTVSGSTISFTIGTGATFQVTPAGYPAPKLAESGAFPPGITINGLTGILGGTPTAAGTFSIALTATSSAGTATQMFTLTVNEISQTITFAAPPSPATYNTTFPVTASSTSGLTVTITPTGVCTISSGTVTMTSGTGTCTLTASQAGNATFSPAPNVVHTVTAALANQTITAFTGAPASAPYGSSFTVAASASSGLTVTISSSGVCSNSGTTVTMTASSGTCSLKASQAGNTNYSAAPSKNQSTTATKANSTTTITSNSPNPSTVNQAVTIAFKVTGTGTPTGSVTVNASTGGSCSGPLTSGAGSCVITFTSTGSPTLTATYGGDGNFNGSTSTGVSQTVNAASGSTLKFSPATINFGTVYVGIPALGETTLTNTGTSMITFTNFSVAPITGDDSSGFLGAELCPKTLNPGKSCIIIMSFTSDSNVTKTHAANLVIADNASGSPQTVLMSATVINPVASLSATSWNFGNQKTGTSSAAKSITLTNSGTTPLILSNLSISGNFALASGTSCTSTTTLAPAGSCLIKVTFTPTSKGSRSGSVTIKDNALSSPSTISLSGTGN